MRISFLLLPKKNLGLHHCLPQEREEGLRTGHTNLLDLGDQVGQGEKEDQVEQVYLERKWTRKSRWIRKIIQTRESRQPRVHRSIKNIRLTIDQGVHQGELVDYKYFTNLEHLVNWGYQVNNGGVYVQVQGRWSKRTMLSRLGDWEGMCTLESI